MTRDQAIEPALPQLTASEISAFCNAIGLAPRQLAQSREDVTARYDLGPRGVWIIGLIEGGVTSPSGLTGALHIGRSLVTAEITRLTEAGLITAVQDAVDGRRVNLALSAAGHRVANELRRAIGTFVTQRLAGYTRDDVLAATRLLQHFAQATLVGEKS